MKTKKILSFFLVLVMVVPMAISVADKIPSVFAENSATFVASTTAISTSFGVALQSYIGVGEGDKASVSIFGAEKYDVYGFEANAGGDIRNVKKSSCEVSMGAPDENGVYSTWTVDPQSIPYQAYEVDVRGISGNIVVGFQGTTEDTEGPLLMQIYDPHQEAYFDVAKREHLNGIVSFSSFFIPRKAPAYGILRPVH